MRHELATIARCQFLPEAEAIRLHLEEQGIMTFLADAEIVNVDWFLGNAVGNIKVQVPIAQADEARHLLELSPYRRSGDTEEDEGDPKTADRCLSCGEPFPEGRSSCAACGWTYESADPDPLGK